MNLRGVLLFGRTLSMLWLSSPVCSVVQMVPRQMRMVRLMVGCQISTVGWVYVEPAIPPRITVPAGTVHVEVPTVQQLSPQQ
jgi:hypothetical protein